MNVQPGMPQPGRDKSVKPLRYLLDGLARVEPGQNCDINGLSLDSRQVSANDLFIAVPGELHDGRDYIQQAVSNGAIAVAYEKSAPVKPGNSGYKQQKYTVPSFDIAGLNQQIGVIAARFYDFPSTHMRLIGITGTNGKTTCAYLLAQALDLLGERCALMGTIGTGFIGALQSSKLTTTDAIATHHTLATQLAANATAVCMEISSHGLEQGRVNQVAFDVAVFTNLSQDHLDYHGSMQRYGHSKQKLFQFDGLNSAVINVDDEFGRQLVENHSAAHCLTYGLHGGDVRSRNLELNENGLAFDVEYQGQSEHVCSSLIGELNVPNLLATITTLISCGYHLKQVAAIVGKLLPPPGRMESLRKRPSQPAVIVDYAHTPDALERALGSLAQLCQGRLWVVFGCGGDRDRSKREQMGRVAELLADQIIVTDDNPRSENPEQITSQILRGMEAGGKGANTALIHDRPLAIETAIRAAASEDIVLIAGKGHEITQTISDRVIDMSDRDIVDTVLEEML